MSESSCSIFFGLQEWTSSTSKKTLLWTNRSFLYIWQETFKSCRTFPVYSTLIEKKPFMWSVSVLVTGSLSQIQLYQTHSCRPHMCRVMSPGWSNPFLPDMNHEQADEQPNKPEPATTNRSSKNFAAHVKYLNVVSCKERPHQKVPPSLNSSSEMNWHSSKRGEKYEFMRSPAAVAQSRLPSQSFNVGSLQHNEPARAVNNITMRTVIL